MNSAQVAVINGPGVPVHEEALRSLLEGWASELDTWITLTHCRSKDALLEELGRAASDGVDAAVINPGTTGIWGTEEIAPEIRAKIVWVSLSPGGPTEAIALRDRSLAGIWGRGVAGYRWAVRFALQRIGSPPVAIAYGCGRDQFGDLRLPNSGDRPYPVAVTVHGGSWREPWGRDTIERLAIDLTRKGYASWNIEYGRVGPHGSGWPRTCEDVSAAVNHLQTLATEFPLDLDRVVFVGHSAGGHLVAWLGRRSGIKGKQENVKPQLIVVLAGVLDLQEFAARGAGSNSVLQFMGGAPEQLRAEYAAACPIQGVPLGIPQVVAVGTRDDPDLIDLSYQYVEAALGAGDDVGFLTFAGADHFDVVEPTSKAWEVITTRIDRSIAPKPLREVT
jgi:acetyl esterase/lipase